MTVPPRPRRSWVVALIAAMAASFAYLAYGPGFESAYGGIGALLLFPFCLGALTTLAGLTSFRALGCLLLPIGLLALSAVLVRTGAEGLICVAMVLPLWIAAALGGGAITLAMQKFGEKGGADQNLLSVGWAVLPFAVIAADRAAPAEWTAEGVTRTIEIDAPPQAVWPLLLSMPHIQPDEGIATFSHDWLSIPRPSGAKLIRRSGKPVRVARWGHSIRFEEEIEVIEPERTLAWKFAFPDPSLQRHTDRHISPQGPVLHIDRGRYTLVALRGGRSKLTLAVTYSQRSRMGWYMAIWGERVLGDVADNVLKIIADRAHPSAW